MIKTPYFQTFENYFWQWEEQGTVISVPNGSTIAYTAFLEEIIPALSTLGLPPFGALLLAIAATSGNAGRMLEDIGACICEIHLEEDKEQALYFLELLSSVPDEFKKGKKKVQLFQAVFQGCHGSYSQKKSPAIMRMLTDKAEMEICLTPVPYNLNILVRDIRVFSLLARKITSVQQILDRVMELPELPDDFDVKEPHLTEQLAVPTDLIDQLSNHEQTRLVGTLIRQLWSGLNIPAHSSSTGSQPLGGISDLTNKGDFDKLLISEFANDDFVFLSRLANNEALFIQREIPPQQQEHERVMLIDSSLKNWGTPRTVAFAIMLAIAKHPKTDIPCRSFVIGDGYKEVRFDSVSELTDALGQLDVRLNCSKGLKAYFRDFPPRRQQEVFLISEKSTVQQAEMLKVLNEFHHALDYRIHTDALGHIDVYKKQQHSRRLIQQLQLPLDDLWKKENRSGSRAVGDEHAHEFPILFYPPNSAELIPSADGMLCIVIASDGNVFRMVENSAMRKRNPGQAKGIDLIRKLPFRGEYEVGPDSMGNSVFIIVDVSQNRGVLYNLKTQKESNVFFDRQGISNGSLFFSKGYFRYHSPAGNWQIDPDTAEVRKDNTESSPVKQKLREARQELLAGFPALTNERSVLKHVTSVSISSRNTLVFNAHEVRLSSPSETIKIRYRKDCDHLLQSHEVTAGTFNFPEGSSVEIHESGMAILKSSNPVIPKIFIPLLLETKLGMATADFFCGDPFFNKGRTKSISVSDFYVKFIEPFMSTILSHGT